MIRRQKKSMYVLALIPKIIKKNQIYPLTSSISCIFYIFYAFLLMHTSSPT